MNIIITSFKQGALKGLYKLGFSNGSLFNFRDVYLGEYQYILEGLDVGSQIDREAFSAFKFAGDCLLVERHAHRLIARSEHSSFLLRQKLLSRGYAPHLVSPVLELLIGLGLVNDARFSQMYLESLLSRKLLGPRRLYARLRAKGIPEDVAQNSLEEIYTDSLQCQKLSLFMEKAGIDLGSIGIAERQKIAKAGFLSSTLKLLQEEL